ncbi:MAG: WecB/TagA/CpsF family glycosyltransferase [Thermomicrobiales bacterium]|nr:WecB/TagA/CpsF family glycosyltransferase [Thermomicrobiales bacterium]
MADREADPRAEAAAVSARAGHTRATILGVPVDLAGRQVVRDRIHAHLGGQLAGMLHLLTLNPEYVMAARADSSFLAAIGRADLIVCDGIGTFVAARLAGLAGIERYTGVELIDDLARFSGFSEQGGVFLLGGRDADAASIELGKRFPAARVCGAWSGGHPDPVWDDESLQRIEASGASILLVGYGAPAQVFWIDRNRERLEGIGVRVAVGIGGALDYLSGHAKPAPPLLRRVGLEWLWRLMHEPWRWKRQLRLLPFALLAVGDAIRTRRTYRILGPVSPDDRRQDSEQ